MINNNINDLWFNDFINNQYKNINQSTRIMSVFNNTKSRITSIKNRDLRLIGSHYFMPYELNKINFNSFGNNLMYLGFNKLLIYNVLSDSLYAKIDEKIKQQPIWAPELFTCDLDPNISFQLIVQTVCINDLFDLRYFNEKILLADNNSKLEDSFNILFCFEGITFPDLYLYFKNRNILITPGGSTLRYFINPLKFRLSQIISAIESGDIKGIRSSFHLQDINKVITTNEGTLILNKTKHNLNLEYLLSKNFTNKK